MNKSKIFLQGLLHAIGVLVYTTAVSLFMFNSQRLVGQIKGFSGPLLMLLLLVLSVAIMGLLVFGRPVYLYFQDKKKEGLWLLFYTLLFIFIFTVSIFLFLIFK